MTFRITTWNVNGIRNPFGYQPWREKRSFEAMFEILEADIVVFQECKIQRKDLKDDMVLVPGWDVHFSLPKHKKGYSGVAIYTKSSTCCPIRAEEGITGVLCPPNSTVPYRELPPEKQIGGYPQPDQLTTTLDEATLDSEGRCVILEFPAFVIIGTYSPANRDETRDEFRTGYLEALDARVRNLVEAGKNVILLGDLNVVRNEMDYAGAVEQLRKDNMTVDDLLLVPSRKLFNELLFQGRVVGDRERGGPVLWDLARLHHPDRQGMYTWWDTKTNARPGNFGSRIDYILCSDGMKEWCTFANIQEGLMGSDHCPVYATLKDKVVVDENEVQLKDMMNPPGMFENGERKREWSTKDLLPLSGRLIPEFDRRRNIKDMFSKKAAATPKATTPSNPPPDDKENDEDESLFLPQIPPEPAVQAKTATVLPKRPAETSSSTIARPLKKTKPAPAPKKNAKTAPAAGQSTLASFFKPNTAASGTPEAIPKPEMPKPKDEEDEQKQDGTSVPPSPSKPASAAPTQGSPAKDSSPKKFIDPIVSKESWSKLLTKRIPPNCEHGEPCISLVTKKAGANKGRSFYICPRPLGPSGQKECGSEWRCGTFVWSSDWTATTMGSASGSGAGSSFP